MSVAPPGLITEQHPMCTHHGLARKPKEFLSIRDTHDPHFMASYVGYCTYTNRSTCAAENSQTLVHQRVTNKPCRYTVISLSLTLPPLPLSLPVSLPPYLPLPSLFLAVSLPLSVDQSSGCSGFVFVGIIAVIFKNVVMAKQGLIHVDRICCRATKETENGR